MPRDPVAVGVERSQERARLRSALGGHHAKPQKPELVVFTLRPAHAPSITLVPSAHPTQVVLPLEEGAPRGAKAVTIAELSPGEGASFDVVSGAWKRRPVPARG